MDCATNAAAEGVEAEHAEDVAPENRLARQWVVTWLRLAKAGGCAAFALTVCTVLASACYGAPPASSVVVGGSVSGFSGTQGANGWFYGYWDRSADADGSFDQATDFQPLKHFGRDPINRLSGHPDFTTGELWNLEDGRFYTSLWAEGGHPHGTLDLGTYARAEYGAVRRWVSTIAGPVTLSGHAGKVMPWGENWSGGVQARIVVDGNELLRADLENQGTDYSLHTTLRVGSRVDFLLGPKPSIGVTNFTATIRTSPSL